MSMNHSFRKGRAWHGSFQSVFLAGLMWTGLISGAFGQIPDLYAKIKALESEFPAPVTRTTVLVGTFNAANGRFSGLVSKVTEVPPETRQNSPVKVPIKQTSPPVVSLPASTVVELIFKIQNRKADFSVTVHGKKYVAAPGRTEIAVELANLSSVNWRIESGGKSYSDKLGIRQPPVIGAGAFTIPFFPVLILYQPPSTHSGNYAALQISGTAGSVITTELGEQRSESTSTTPVVFTAYDKMMEFAIKGAKALDSSPDPVSQAMTKALEIMAGALGEYESSKEVGKAFGSTLKLSYRETLATGFQTEMPNTLGPGKGDLFFYYRNPRVVWYTEKGRLYLSIIGYDFSEQKSTRQLEDLLKTLKKGSEDYQSLEAMLKMNPFYGKSSFQSLPSDRFSLKSGPHIIGYGGLKEIFSMEKTSQSVQSRSTFTTETIDWDPGWFKYFVPDYPEAEHSRVTLSYSSAEENYSAERLQAEINLQALPDDQEYGVEIYFDNVFGSLAVTQVNLRKNPLLEGFVFNKSGGSITGQIVTLRGNGRVYTCLTGKNGAFSFRFFGIDPGTYILMSGTTRKSVFLDGTKTVKMNLTVSHS